MSGCITRSGKGPEGTLARSVTCIASARQIHEYAVRGILNGTTNFILTGMETGRSYDDVLSEAEAVRNVLGRDYALIADAPAFGDVVTFSAGDAIFHSAVYIAADVVFTRNGQRACHPWMLMTLNDMKHFYAQSEPVIVRYFRRQDFRRDRLHAMGS